MALATDFSIPFQGMARVYVGDPTTPGGMTHLGYMSGAVSVQSRPRLVPWRARGQAAPSRTYYLGHEVTATIPMAELDVEKLAAVSVGATVSDQQAGGAKALGIGQPAAAQPVQLQTVLIIPESEVSYGESAPHALWLWACSLNGPGVFTYDEPSEDGPSNEIEVVCHVKADNPLGHELMTFGPPAEAGITVNL